MTNVSIDEALKAAPAVKTLGGAFPAQADMKKGDRFMGIYQGSVEVTLPGKKPFLSHTFDLGVSETAWKREKKAYTPARGERVTISGAVLDRILTLSVIGSAVVVSFDGMGEAKGGNNAPKLYTVSILGA